MIGACLHFKVNITGGSGGVIVNKKTSIQTTPRKHYNGYETLLLSIK